MQTPQGFPVERLRAAIEQAAGALAAATDCASLVEGAGGRVICVEGDTRNLKVTTAEDLAAGAGAGRVIVDYHLHLRPDGTGLDEDAYTPEHLAQYAATARERGVGEIAITEHIYRFAQASHLSDHVYWREHTLADIDRYCSGVAAARDSGLPILLGIELDWLGHGGRRRSAGARRRLRVGRRARLGPLVGAARLRPPRLLHLGDTAG